MATAGLELHRAERTDVLADALAGLIADAPLRDPFAEEIVVVAALGMERWLAQRLSHRLGVAPGRGDGVCAGVRFARPGALVAELTRPPGWRDPWDPASLLWPVAATLDTCLDEPWCRAVAHHLRGTGEAADDLRRDRRLGVARMLADRFHSYAVQRPEMTAAWTAGADHDGTGRALAPATRWQAELWRRVRAVVGAPPPDERLAEAAASLRIDPAAVDLPERLSLFGHHRLPLAELRLLAALAEHRAVHLWMPHPSPAWWDDRSAEAAGGIVTRADLPGPHDDDNPLLAALGADLREIQRSIAAVAPGAESRVLPAVERPDTLLGRLQADLVANRPGAAIDRDPTDRSVQIHACHGPARQVDVLRDVLVGLLEDDPTLEPRDILVLCPDVDAYAPLFRAAFGLGDVIDGGHPGHQLRVMLADRSASAANALLGTVLDLLDLAHRGRFTAGEVLDLLAAAPVRARFSFDDDALERIGGWIEQSAVRWGLDAEHRSGFGLRLAQNSWRSGVDRVLVGVTASEEPGAHVGDVLPLDDVGSNDIDLAGRLGDFLDRLGRAADDLGRPQSAAQWAEAIDSAVRSLTAVDDKNRWQLDRLRRDLADLAGAPGSLALRPAEMLALLRDRWSGRAGRAGFRTGGVTVCTMVPMRSVPHRVVAMVGLDDGAFPRAGAVHGDDVLAATPLTGERDVRSEDRQLFLDAIMAATEHLVVCFTGADEQRGQPRPPAVPLGELIDQLVRCTGASREELVVDHPLQPFDTRNLTPGALWPGAEPFTFDPAALTGALAARRATAARARLMDGPLDPPAGPAPDLTLRELSDMFTHPAKAFLRQRLGVTLPPQEGALPEEIPLAPDALERWSIGDQLLRDVLAGADPAAAAEAARRRGTLPPGRLGLDLLAEIGDVVGPLAAQAIALRGGEPRTIDLDVELAGGRRLTGAVDGVHDDRIVVVTYSSIRSIRARQLIRAWLQLLALSAFDPVTPWSAQLAGRDRGGIQVVRLRPVGPDAPAILRELVDLRDAGLLRPLPLPPDLSLEFARNLSRNPRSAFGRAKAEWERTNSPVPSDREDPENSLVWGAMAPFQVLREAGFDELAPRVWNPVLEARQ